MNVPAPPAPVHNGFAIPRLYKMSGATTPTWKYVGDWPLTPWIVHGHDDLYAPVDATQRLYDDFIRRVPPPDDLLDVLDNPGPPLVVVSGGKQCGKSSLMNRCANYLAETLSATPAAPMPDKNWRWAEKQWSDNVDFVVLRDVGGPKSLIYGKYGSREELSESFGQHMYEVIAEKLEQRPPFSGKIAAAGPLESRYRKLSTLLLDNRHHVLVLVPKVPYRSQEVYESLLHACYVHRAAGIVMFLECSESEAQLELSQDVWQFEKEAPSKVIHLRIGSLNVTDCAEFIKVRLSPGLWNSPFVEVAPETFSGDQSGLDYSCVGELQKIFFGLAGELIASGKTRITLELLSSYRDRIREQEADSLRRSDRRTS